MSHGNIATEEKERQVESWLSAVVGTRNSEEATSADIQIVSLGGRLIKVSTGCLAGLVLSTVCRRQSCGASCRGRSWWLVWQRKLNATWTVEVHTICGGDSS